jgi:2,4-dienoyl-CoA reductase (NADPH2)
VTRLAQPARLAQPVSIGRHEAPARVVFGPHETNLARGRALGDRHVAYYRRRAEGGAGVIVTETASVTANDWPYERAPLAAEGRDGWKAIALACRPYGTLVLAGLGHAGGQGSSAYSQEVMWGPSRVADVVSREPPAALESDGIEVVVAAFARAARAAIGSGLAGVEVDSGAWSLLRQFQSGLTNQRTDGYGSDKLRLTREVLGAVRRAIGPEHVLALRLSCDEMAPWAGITPEQAAVAAADLAPLVDLLTVVRAGPFATAAYRPDFHTPPTTNLELCRVVRAAVGGRVPVVLQGSVVDPVAAEDALADGAADLVEMTRAQIADPRLVTLLRAGTPERIRPCLLCNQTCQVRDNRNPIVTCVGEPRSGRETEDPAEGAERTRPAGRPVLVVGGGPAGLECARVLAGSGRAVRLCERGSRLGGALALAATGGSGRERLRLITDWLAAECARVGVDVRLGTDVDVAAVVAARGDGWDVVLATGSRAVTDRYSPEGPPAVVDALSLFASGPAGLPEGPVVVDDPVGDSVGVAVAEWLTSSGPDRIVTLVSPDPVAGTLLARSGDLAAANGRLQRAGVVRQLRSLVRGAGGGTVQVSDVWTGEPARLPAAVLVDCGHRVAEDSLYRALGDPTVARIGDCVAPRTVHEAILEGRRAALQLAGTGIGV